MKRFFAALALVMTASLFYVYQEVEAVKVGYVIRKQQETRTQFLDRARALKYNIARLTSPNNMERRLSAQRIVLQSPKTWQTLVIGQPKKPDPKMAQMFAARPSFLGKLMVGTAQAEAKEN
jgi:hypothetical protein